MYQYGWTSLIYAAMCGHLPVVEYLVEKGADMEAKDLVSDVISLMWNHPYVTHKYTSMNASAWIHSIDACKEWSFTSGWISGGERSWYRGKGYCKRCHIIGVKPHIRHTWMCVNASGWVHSIATCCKDRSFTSGGISITERSWSQCSKHCKWATQHGWIVRHTCMS